MSDNFYIYEKTADGGNTWVEFARTHIEDGLVQDVIRYSKSPARIRTMPANEVILEFWPVPKEEPKVNADAQALLDALARVAKKNPDASLFEIIKLEMRLSPDNNDRQLTETLLRFYV